MREIKRYNNRKLYDVKEAKYTTMNILNDVLKTGETISVKDNDSKQDVTRNVLIEILHKQLTMGLKLSELEYVTQKIN
jgi:polyhydroxyalkanoate synthesis regulator protein